MSAFEGKNHRGGSQPTSRVFEAFPLLRYLLMPTARCILGTRHGKGGLKSVFAHFATFSGAVSPFSTAVPPLPSVSNSWSLNEMFLCDSAFSGSRIDPHDYRRAYVQLPFGDEELHDGCVQRCGSKGWISFVTYLCVVKLNPLERLLTQFLSSINNNSGLLFWNQK